MRGQPTLSSKANQAQTPGMMAVIGESLHYSRALEERGRHDRAAGMIIFLTLAILLLSLVAILLAHTHHLW